MEFHEIDFIKYFFGAGEGILTFSGVQKNTGYGKTIPVFLAQAKGFEPPWAFTQTVFKTASL